LFVHFSTDQDEEGLALEPTFLRAGAAGAADVSLSTSGL
jgi:hypothetical protein